MTILAIIEDDSELRTELAEEMRYRGHTVYEAADGEEGFRLISEVVPDVVLCDIEMPGHDGYSLMRRVRANDSKFADISFIFVTGRIQPDEVMRGLRAGADDYIVKPIDFEYLDLKVDATIRKKARLFQFWRPANVLNITVETLSSHPAPVMSVLACVVIGAATAVLLR